MDVSEMPKENIDVMCPSSRFHQFHHLTGKKKKKSNEENGLPTNYQASQS